MNKKAENDRAKFKQNSRTFDMDLEEEKKRRNVVETDFKGRNFPEISLKFQEKLSESEKMIKVMESEAEKFKYDMTCQLFDEKAR